MSLLHQAASFFSTTALLPELHSTKGPELFSLKCRMDGAVISSGVYSGFCYYFPMCELLDSPLASRMSNLGLTTSKLQQLLLCSDPSILWGCPWECSVVIGAGSVGRNQSHQPSVFDFHVKLIVIIAVGLPAWKMMSRHDSLIKFGEIFLLIV